MEESQHYCEKRSWLEEQELRLEQQKAGLEQEKFGLEQEKMRLRQVEENYRVSYQQLLEKERTLESQELRETSFIQPKPEPLQAEDVKPRDVKPGDLLKDVKVSIPGEIEELREIKSLFVRYTKNT